MAEANNVFISWSGPRSKSAAEALKQWLPLVVPTASPWMSAADIDKGARWREEVAAALDSMKAGIICLTPENLTAEWLLFEAGALSKTRDPKTRVWTYLLAELKAQHLKDPLAMFQATAAEKEDTRKLVHSVNKSLEAAVPESRVNHLFDKLWPDLEKELDIPEPSGAAPPKRSTEEIAADTLELIRGLAPLIHDIASESEIVRRNRLIDEEFRNALRRLPAGTVLTTNTLASSGSIWGTLGQVNNSESIPSKEPEVKFNLPASPQEKKPLSSRKAERKRSGSS